MNGIINVLKPPSMTSSNVVTYIRKLLKIQKVGHTGTLDPQAAGVLPICIGKATKISSYLTDKSKTYICEMHFGLETDTLDSEGKVVSASSTDALRYDDIQKAFFDFTGKIKQIPPMYSAIKYDGKKMYQLARNGISIDLPPRDVTIFSNEIINFYPPDRLLFRVVCSKGTYIRSLCRDIGRRLGCGAYMSFLLRSRVGQFDLENSHTLDEIEKFYLSQRIDNFLIPIDKTLIDYKEIYFCNDVYDKLINGNSVNAEFAISNYENIVFGEDLKIYCKGQFIGIGCLIESEDKKIVKVKNVFL